MKKVLLISFVALLVVGLVIILWLPESEDQTNTSPRATSSISHPNSSPGIPASPNPESAGAPADDASWARAYCTACHLFPDPGLLDKASWTQGALPEMKPWLGLAPPPIERARDGQPVLSSNLFPAAPLLSTQDWHRLTAYFENNAPESLAPALAENLAIEELHQFQVDFVPYIREVAMISMVRIDAPRRRYFIGDALTRTLEVLSAAGEREFTVEFISGPIDLRLRPDGFDLLVPGRLFPSDQLKGALLQITPGPDAMDMRGVLGELRRPTDMEFADLNGDGREDAVICQFGHRLGRLSWFEQLPDGRHREHVLLERAGATAAKVRDFDADGRPDILALMAQAWEGVSLFHNLGTNRFEERKILEQHPAFGYAGLEVMDWNGDGHWDFVTVNGDNGEYAAPVKPYHGLRLYLNDGRGTFREEWFQPLPGAYQVRVRDFDLDGDPDVAAISYFPDYERAPSSGFLYLQNEVGGEFSRWSFVQSTVGRWISMDAGDIDGDGDEDLVLGSLVQGPDTIPIPAAVQEKWQRRTPPVLVLKNRAR